ncbi:MAG: hypothetical protein JWN78_1547 [Bacteroidota bacterium]|nr:hypothetical protein [Bacteroidota bacterium]
MSKTFIFISLFITSILTSKAQNTKYDTIVLPKVILFGDTLPEIVLDPVEINATRLSKVNLEEWQMRYLRIVYPYALRTARLTKKINDDLQICETKKELKRYLEECEKVLRVQF